LDDPRVAPKLRAFLHASCPKALELLGHEATRTGVSPWRADQFENLAKQELKSGKLLDAVYHIGIGTHMIADQAVPWHSVSDAHGVAAGHSNIHIFLEGCTDSFLKLNDQGQAGSFQTGLEELARKARADILVTLERDAKSTSSLSIRELQESQKRIAEFEALDTGDGFQSGA